MGVEGGMIMPMVEDSVMENPPFFDYGKGRQHFLLSPLDYRTAKTGGAVNGGTFALFILTVDWLGWFCYLFPHHSCVLASFRIFIICI